MVTPEIELTINSRPMRVVAEDDGYVRHMTSCHDTSNVITIGRGGRTRIVERVVTKRLDGIDDEKGTGGLVDGHDGSSHMWLTPQW